MRLRRSNVGPAPLLLSCLVMAFCRLALSAPADSLQDGFQNPPASARPQTWWHWMNGNVTREGITADLEAMQRAGLGGAQIFNVDCGIPAGPVKFASTEWREMVRHASREAQRLGLELCLHNCAGWSSSGGPWITPEQAMQHVTTSEQKVSGPRHFSGLLPTPPAKLDCYHDIAVLAFPTPGGSPGSLRSPKFSSEAAQHDAQAGSGLGRPFKIDNLAAKGGFNGEFVQSSPADARIPAGWIVRRSAIVELTSSLQPGGKLDWDVPAGEWTILRLGYTPIGVQNHPAPAEGTGLECDKLDPAALDAHWAGFVQKVLDDLGPLAGESQPLNNVLIDSYEVGGQNWTPRFREEFQKRRGYDPLLYLPTLTGRVVDSLEISERFLWDIRRTIADLFAENYYGRFQQLCHQHGLKASLEPYTGPFESLQCGEKADIPMGEFWVGGAPDQSVKLASSVGHIYGQQIIGAESFTAAPRPAHGRWLDDPYALKTLGDLVFCQGVNRYIFHRYAMQPWTNRWPGMTMGQWGTHFDRTSTWWEPGRAWLQYVARCQYVLQQGRCVADAAYFCGESAPVEMRAADPALPSGYYYDGMNAGVLLHHAAVKDGRLVLTSGASYGLLVLPASEPAASPSLLDKLAGFAADGLTVVGARPQASPSLERYPQCDVEVKELAARLWGDCDGRAVTEHKFGKGRVVWNRPLAQVFRELNLKPDFEFPNTTGAELAFIHRRAGDAEIYFVSNQRKRYETVECTFRVDKLAPEIWEPETGRIGPAPVWRRKDGRTVVPLPFTPAGSVFVVFRPQAENDHLVAISRNSPAAEENPVRTAQLRILKAVYGTVPGSQDQLDVTEKVRALLASGTRQVPANNDMAGEDPASGVVKRLRVEFRLKGRPQTLETTEGSTLELPVGSEVVKASYGRLSGGQTWLDLTGRLQKLVDQGSRRIRADNSFAGIDPAPGQVKQLRVEFRTGGQRRTLEVREGQNLDLPARAKVLEARYGQLAKRSLHPPETADVTAKLVELVSGGALSIPVDNELAGYDPAPGAVKELRVEYSLRGAVKHATASENETLNLPEAGQPAGTPPSFAFTDGPAGQQRLLALTPGRFALEWASGRKIETECLSVPAPLELTGPWEIHFPPGWGAPERITLESLLSWADHFDAGVKYFSGTATYQKDFELPAELTNSARELWLDLGTVKNLAEASLNGTMLGILWKPPFRVNVSAAARPGLNRLEIKVTNLWPNRLIGDEQLPPDCEWNGRQLKDWPSWLLEGKPSPTGRVTFTTWHHWTKGEPLLDSGLLGPVTLQAAEEVVVH